MKPIYGVSFKATGEDRNYEWIKELLDVTDSDERCNLDGYKVIFTIE